MVNMKKYLLGGVLLCAGAFIVSCSSDEELTPSGEGTISLDIRTETGFLSRAVNEADYMNVNNYTVQLLSGEEVQNEWKYTDLPESMQVNAGTYQVKAYYGEDVAASTETMYVEGVSEEVTLVDKDTKTISVTCKPVCAKVSVKFADAMADYFTDYSVTFKTVALGEGNFVWKKDSTDPVYLKVGQDEEVTATINYTENGAQKSVEKKYVMSPGTGMTITVNPVQSTGSMGISITVDESTNDIEQDIEVPGDWIDETPAAE